MKERSGIRFFYYGAMEPVYTHREVKREKRVKIASGT
jgi:hypothetical protein